MIWTSNFGHSVLDVMNIFISTLLGAATFAFQDTTSKAFQEVTVSVWPPGSNIYLDECVLLQCTVMSRSTVVKNYQWFRSNPDPAPNPRHLVTGDSYFISAVTMEDADRYWCQAEDWNNRSVVAQPVTLSVSELHPPSLALTPSIRQMLAGENFTVQCPASDTNSSGWKLVHFFPDRREISTYSFSSLDRITEMTTEDVTAGTTGVIVPYSPLGGATSANKSDTFDFTAASGRTGLYWCEDAKARSNAVIITVSYDNIVLKTPAFPVFKGDKVVLYCQYPTGNHTKVVFFKNGAVINTSSSFSSVGVINMTIENVSQEDEGLYKCATQDRKMESPESWLSVRPGPAGSLKWLIVSFVIVLVLLIPLTVWLICRFRYQTFCTHSCWSIFKRDIPAVALPATKQDVTEVQWDLSWMEMSSLLDKHLYPGT